MAADGELSHLDSRGRAKMVDVGDKATTSRVAVARGEVRMEAATLARIAEGRIEKGDVFAIARVAGIQAAKRTSEWIPLCHPLGLDALDLELEARGDDPAGPCVWVEARARTTGRTGVEMEALVAVSAACLTLYDMCKAVDRAMTIERVRLVEKTGGKSGTWHREGEDSPEGEPASVSRARSG